MGCDSFVLILLQLSLSPVNNHRPYTTTTITWLMESIQMEVHYGMSRTSKASDNLVFYHSLLTVFLAETTLTKSLFYHFKIIFCISNPHKIYSTFPPFSYLPLYFILHHSWLQGTLWGEGGQYPRLLHPCCVIVHQPKSSRQVVYLLRDTWGLIGMTPVLWIPVLVPFSNQYRVIFSRL